MPLNKPSPSQPLTLWQLEQKLNGTAKYLENALERTAENEDTLVPRLLIASIISSARMTIKDLQSRRKRRQTQLANIYNANIDRDDADGRDKEI